MTFSEALLQWFATNGRTNLPWQNPRSPYNVWISEIMLQQTQVKTVIPYFNRFINRFPSIQTLAAASIDEVLAHWSGLGYYSRARNLHKTSILICQQYNGEFPNSLEHLTSLPGIGDSTAAAIASLAFNKPTAILDGNVRRVLSRYFLVEGLYQQARVKKKLWQHANECMPEEDCASYTQAIMDLGATCCTLKKPNCTNCPMQENCLAKIQNRVHEFPNKKPSKIKPIKQQQFLLLHNNDNLIFLTKNPPSGIWGGLWSIPAIELHSCPLSFIREKFYLCAENAEPLLDIRHSFSHFHLEIKALTLRTKPILCDKICEPSGQWFSMQELEQLGVSKPVRTIINAFGNLSSGV